MDQVHIKFECQEFLPKNQEEGDPSPSTSKQNKCFEKWSMQQNMLYIQFLRQNKDKLYSEFDRRSARIFSLMSKFVKTRTSEQCRTHHQKMIQQSKSIDLIIEKMLKKKERLNMVREPKKRGRKPKNYVYQEKINLKQADINCQKVKCSKTGEFLIENDHPHGIQYQVGCAQVFIDWATMED